MRAGKFAILYTAPESELQYYRDSGPLYYPFVSKDWFFVSDDQRSYSATKQRLDECRLRTTPPGWKYDIWRVE